METSWYALSVDDYFCPSFCSGRKLLFGMLDEISRWKNRLYEESTFNEVDAAEQLREASFRAESYAHMGKHTWTFMNLWDFPYELRFDSASFHQVILFLDGTYYRCLSGSMKGLSYKGIKNWDLLKDGFWGLPGFFNCEDTSDGSFAISTCLYAVEETYDSFEMAVEDMKDNSAIRLACLCEEIFGDG